MCVFQAVQGEGSRGCALRTREQQKVRCGDNQSTWRERASAAFAATTGPTARTCAAGETRRCSRKGAGARAQPHGAHGRDGTRVRSLTVAPAHGGSGAAPRLDDGGDAVGGARRGGADEVRLVQLVVVDADDH
eukprot:6191000-Pleurochrysis_carterae.AAC.1